MKKALTAACAVTILVALSAQDASATDTKGSGRAKIAEAGYGKEVWAEPPAEIATAAEQPVQASGEATNEMREANEARGVKKVKSVENGLVVKGEAASRSGCAGTPSSAPTLPCSNFYRVA